MYEKQLLTVRDVARRCGRSEETVRRWIWSGKLPARKLGNQLFVEAEELARFQRGPRVSESAVAYRPSVRGHVRGEPVRFRRRPYDKAQKEEKIVGAYEGAGYTKEELLRQIDEDEKFAVEMRAKYGTVDLADIFRELREEDD